MAWPYLVRAEMDSFPPVQYPIQFLSFVRLYLFRWQITPKGDWEQECSPEIQTIFSFTAPKKCIPFQYNDSFFAQSLQHNSTKSTESLYATITREWTKQRTAFIHIHSVLHSFIRFPVHQIANLLLFCMPSPWSISVAWWWERSVKWKSVRSFMVFVIVVAFFPFVYSGIRLLRVLFVNRQTCIAKGVFKLQQQTNSEPFTLRASTNHKKRIDNGK